jgi:hypothetical protein
VPASYPVSLHQILLTRHHTGSGTGALCDL